MSVPIFGQMPIQKLESVLEAGPVPWRRHVEQKNPDRLVFRKTGQKFTDKKVSPLKWEFPKILAQKKRKTGEGEGEGEEKEEEEEKKKDIWAHLSPSTEKQLEAELMRRSNLSEFRISPAVVKTGTKQRRAQQAKDLSRKIFYEDTQELYMDMDKIYPYKHVQLTQSNGPSVRVPVFRDSEVMPPGVKTPAPRPLQDDDDDYVTPEELMEEHFINSVVVLEMEVDDFLQEGDYEVDAGPPPPSLPEHEHEQEKVEEQAEEEEEEGGEEPALE